MKTVAIIPARGGSKRIPNKNIIDLNGKPLIAYSIEYALSHKAIIDDVYVSTDSAAIKKVALKFGAKIINRPQAISGDYEPSITVLQHALTVMEGPIESVVLLQPTNPLRPKLLLEEAYKIFMDNNSQSLFTVTKYHKKLGKIKNNTFQPFNYDIGQRSQDIEPLYFENGLIYITKADIIKKGIIFDQMSFPLIVDHKFAQIDIDTFEDLKYAEYLLSSSGNSLL